jgi:hypothetical protein
MVAAALVGAVEAGLSNLSASLGAMLPDPVLDRLSVATAALPASLAAAVSSPSQVLLLLLAALAALALLEQAKFQLGRLGRGQRLPGAAVAVAVAVGVGEARIRALS